MSGHVAALVFGYAGAVASMWAVARVAAGPPRPEPPTAVVLELTARGDQ